jgi:fumarate reductase flavoprotein subunit
VRRCRDFGRDLARQPVEVGPTAHFMMGGVVVDPACRTAVEGLFAAGEDTGGVHGANRLGGNGVADSTVFGGIAGDVMADFVAGRPAPRPALSAVQPAMRAAEAPLGRSGREDLYGLQRLLREAMWDHAGLVRDAAGLREARRVAEDVEQRLDAAGVPPGRELSLAWQDWLNLKSQALVARLVVASALERRESRGAHYRSDHPEPAAEPIYAVIAEARGGEIACRRQRVAMTRARPAGARAYEPVEVGD